MKTDLDSKMKRTEMRVIRWMCSVSLREEKSSPKLCINLVYCQHDIIDYMIGGYRQFLEGHHLTESNTGLASMQKMYFQHMSTVI